MKKIKTKRFKFTKCLALALTMALLVSGFGSNLVFAVGRDITVAQESEQDINITTVENDEKDDENYLYFSAVNAGYTSPEKVMQNYDFVELRKTRGESLDLAGYWIEYENSVGTIMEPWRFDIDAVLEAERVVLGFVGSPQYKDADTEYLYDFGSGSGLASTTGKLRLYLGERVVDEVCWGKTTCEKHWEKFKSNEEDNFTMRLCLKEDVGVFCEDDKVGSWLLQKYYPIIDETAISSIIVGDDVMANCSGLRFNEIYTYFEEDYAEQFVEIYNPTAEIVPLSNCKLVYKSHSFGLEGEIEPDEYYVYQNPELKLTKNPASSNSVVLVDGNGEKIDELVYLNGQKKGASYALVEETVGEVAVWKQSYRRTPGTENIYQEFRTCPIGKIINPSTGNCINLQEDEPLPECPPGKYRNPLTNRCKSYESLTSILEPCPDGYYRNPETNRCKKVASDTNSQLAACPEGYERNPETNRCRKVRINVGADYGVKPTIEDRPTTFVAYGLIGLICAMGVAYVVFQFRQEIGRGMRKLKEKIRK